MTTLGLNNVPQNLVSFDIFFKYFAATNIPLATLDGPPTLILSSAVLIWFISFVKGANYNKKSTFFFSKKK